jgi:hypothetical protein
VLTRREGEWHVTPKRVLHSNFGCCRVTTENKPDVEYAISRDNPETFADLDGHACGSGSPTTTCPDVAGGTTPATPTGEPAAQKNGTETPNSATQKAQQQNQQGQVQFQCTNATCTTSTQTMVVTATPDNSSPSSAAKKSWSSYIKAATDIAGIIGIFVKEKVAKPLGRFGAAVSILNDPGPKNVTTNVLGLIPGFDGPMAITGAFTDFLDWGAKNSTPGPRKVYDQEQLGPLLPEQDPCAAFGAPSCWAPQWSFGKFSKHPERIMLLLSDLSSLLRPPYIFLILGVISISAAAVFTCTGKVWVRLNGWVYRAKEPRWFWYEVAGDYLIGIGFIGYFLYKIYGLSKWAVGKNDEERMVQLGRFLRISRHIGLPKALTGLEWFMEIESLKKQLSRPGFYDLDFGGRRLSLWWWNVEFHFSLRWEVPTAREKSHASLCEKQPHCVKPDPEGKWS